MRIIEWIIENWDSVSVVLFVLLGITAYVVKNGINAIKEMAFAWYTEVEAEYGGGTGALKRSEVAAKIYAQLPGFLQLLLPSSVISKILEKGLEEAKKVWETNSAISNYIISTADASANTKETVA